MIGARRRVDVGVGAGDIGLGLGGCGGRTARPPQRSGHARPRKDEPEGAGPEAPLRACIGMSGPARRTQGGGQHTGGGICARTLCTRLLHLA